LDDRPFVVQNVLQSYYSGTARRQRNLAQRGKTGKQNLGSDPDGFLPFAAARPAGLARCVSWPLPVDTTWWFPVDGSQLTKMSAERPMMHPPNPQLTAGPAQLTESAADLDFVSWARRAVATNFTRVGGGGASPSKHDTV
jgi:hypothetical protein